jgi:hypothetical protein
MIEKLLQIKLQEFFCIKELGYFFPNNLLTIKRIIANIAITIKIPTPIPALNIPSTREHPVSDNTTVNSSNSLIVLFCIISII